MRRKELEQAKRTNIRSVAGRQQKRQEEGRPDNERRHWVFACVRFTSSGEDAADARKNQAAASKSAQPRPG